MTSTIGRYTIIRPLGAGGMADVYLAHDPVLGREVAIKAPRLRPETLARFEVEARAVARLEHPAIVPLYEYGEQDGRPYLVMRHMRGGSLADRLRRGPLSLQQTLPVLDRIAAALDYAHGRGVIHRDVKPGNILFDEHGHAFLSDFGIARLEAHGDVVAGPRLTVVGAMPGSPAYLSPEQARGALDLDGRSDIYSLGIVVYEMLSGSPPYPVGSLRTVTPVPSILQRRKGLPAGVHPVVERALAVEPSGRYQRATALATDLRRAAGGAARPAGPWPWLVVGGGLALFLLALIIIFGGVGGNKKDNTADRSQPATVAPQRIAAESSVKTPSPAPTATAETPPTVTPSPAGAPFTLGQTARGTPIEAYRFGDGPQKLLFVGGLTGGYAPSTEGMARAAVAHFAAHPEAVPDGVTILIVPLVSPDTTHAPGEFAGRLNANGVDINRNWGCEWIVDPLWDGEPRPGSGGGGPFSEAETILLRDFILSESPAVAVFWYARAYNGLVSPGGCGPSSLVSTEAADIFGGASGYVIRDFGALPGTTVNGDATNWLDSIGIPAVSVLLPSFNTVDEQNNLNGIMAIIESYADRPPATPLPAGVVLGNLQPATAVTAAVSVDTPGPVSLTPTPQPVVCQTSPGPRWEDTLWRLYADRLGCAISQEIRGGGSAFQSFQHGVTVWRQDRDRIYVLYNNGTFSAHPDDAPDGWKESDLVKGGFGYLWRNNQAVRDGLGQPRGAEAGTTDFAVQDFSGGVIFYFYENDARNYALFTDNNTWTSIQE